MSEKSIETLPYVNAKKILHICILMLLYLSIFSGCSTSNENSPELQVDLKSGNYECVSLITNKGSIVLGLDKVNAPQSVSNFLNYTTSQFYDGTIFHRVIDDFMIQGGGYTETFDQKETEAPIINEADNGLKNIRGSIATARTSDPHSATAQFFINTVDNNFLNHKDKSMSGWGYAVFGQVINGMDVVDTISKINTGPGGLFPKDVPTETITIQTAEVVACENVSQQ